MNSQHINENDSEFAFVKQFAEHAFFRSSGAPLLTGNKIDLLLDSSENFPAWEKAIASATESICIEMYLFADDSFGRKIRDLLAERASFGVEVYLLYDWMGSWRGHFSDFFQPIIKAGGQVQAFNPPSLSKNLSLFERDHRKLIIVDQRVAFISGLCISNIWDGDKAQKTAGWRDTGVCVQGPIVSSAISSFVDSWLSCARQMPESLQKINQENAGKINARLIVTNPNSANLMRLDLLIASFARQSLWLTDAYFIGTGVYIAALNRAARDGVDVRLLVPRSSDIPWISMMSRTLYRPLLEAGVRVFEWNGKMIHAKTSVADGCWARIGSSNLNLSSWLANRELDVFVEDHEFSQKMAAQFLLDLDNSTEIVLSGKLRRPKLSQERDKYLTRLPGTKAFSGVSAAARQAARIGDALGAVVKGTRHIETSEASSFLSIGIILLSAAILFGAFPNLIVVPAVIILASLGIMVISKSIGLYRKRKQLETKN